MLQTVGENSEIVDNRFSFNDYSVMNLDEFAETFPFKDTDKYTLFMVFEQSKEGTIANVTSKNHAIEFGDSYITTHIRRPRKFWRNCSIHSAHTCSAPYSLAWP